MGVGEAMAESATDLRKRVWLETECGRTAKRLSGSCLAGEHFTLLFFDLGESGHVAFVTTLTMTELVVAFTFLLQNWKSGLPRVAFSRPGERLMSRKEVIACGNEVQAPPGVGYALLIGKGERTSYIADGERSGVATMIETELLPNWRDMAGAEHVPP